MKGRVIARGMEGWKGEEDGSHEVPAGGPCQGTSKQGLENPPSVFEGSLVRYPGGKRVRRPESAPQLFRGSVARLLGLNDFISPEVWRAAAIEAVGMAGLVFTSVTSVVASFEGGFDTPTQAIGLINGALLSFFILATAPSSGGHVNPTITLATMMTGLTSLPRGILYILAQMVGSVTGAACAKAVMSEEKVALYQLGGCLLRQTIPDSTTGVLNTTGLDATAGFLAEFCFSFTLLFLAFGIALDPKQGQVLGPIIGPLMIGAIVGMLIFVSGTIAAPGYVGAGLNPARCFGPAVALGGDLWDDHWVFWLGPMAACAALALVYNLIPPHHSVLFKEGRGLFPVFRLRLDEDVVETETKEGQATENGFNRLAES